MSSIRNRASGRRGNGLNVANLIIPVISSVEQVEEMLEQFFIFHTNFLWEPAKTYIERERDAFRASHHGHGHGSCSSVLSSLMGCLGQLTLADKNYLTLQFFSSKVFQRKDSVKVSYENLRLELLRLEERGSSIGQQRNSSSSQPNTPHHQNHLLSSSPASSSGGGGGSQLAAQMASDQAQDVFEVEELFMNEEGRKSVSPVQNAFSEAELQQQHQLMATPTPPKSQSLLSRLFRFNSSNRSSNRSNQSMSPSTPANDSICSSNDDAPSPIPLLNEGSTGPLQTEITCSLDSMDRFAAHLSGQLVHYVKVRIEMIDLYDRLSSVCGGGAAGSMSRKFVLMEELYRSLKETHDSADRHFHHPVLSRLKAMFMFEADVLLSLLTAHISIQGWHFLEALFLLQEATNKLNLMANARDMVLKALNGGSGNVSAPAVPGVTGPVVSPLISSSGSVSGGTGNLRRNFTNASLSSSGSSTLSVPSSAAAAAATAVSGTATGSSSSAALPSAASPGGSTLSAMSHFIFPGSGWSNMPTKSGGGFFTSGKSSSSSGATAAAASAANMPLLIQWLHRFKLYLLSKYSFYFHSLLMVHLTPASIAAAASIASTGGGGGSGSNSATGSVSSFTASLASVGSSKDHHHHGHHHGHHHHSHSSSANYAQMEAQMRQLCAKQCPPFDFHSKIVQFVRKYDATYVILLFDIKDQGMNREFNVSGYRSPFTKKEEPTGIKTYPIVYAYPVEFPQNHMPSLIMTMGERRKELNSSDTVLVMHNRPNAVHGDHHQHQHHHTNNGGSPGSPMMVGPGSIGPAQIKVHNIATSGTSNTSSSNNNSIPNATYFLIRPDPLFTLIMICEKPRADTEAIVKFMTDLTSLLKGSRIFAALRSGTLK